MSDNYPNENVKMNYDAVTEVHGYWDQKWGLRRHVIKIVMVTLRMNMLLIIMILNTKMVIISMIGYNHDDYFYEWLQPRWCKVDYRELSFLITSD